MWEILISNGNLGNPDKLTKYPAVKIEFQISKNVIGEF